MILLVHSSGLGARQWGRLQTLIPESVAISLTGYDDVPFDSEKPALEQDTEHLVDLVKSHKDVHLVGHSYGGLVVLEVARRHPSILESITVIEPVVITLLKDELALRMESLITDLNEAWSNHQEEDALRIFVDFWSEEGNWDLMPEKIRASMMAVREKMISEIRSVSVYSEIPKFPNMHVILSEDCRPEARMMCSSLARHNNAPLYRTPGAHMSPITHPDATAGLLKKITSPASEPI